MSERNETRRVTLKMPLIIHERLKQKQTSRRLHGLPYLTFDEITNVAILDGLLLEEYKKERK